MFCPICKAEYRAGITRCKDCGAELMDGAEPRRAQRSVVAFDCAPLLWKGCDPVLYAALLHALHEARIPYYDTPAREFESRLITPFPSTFDAVPGFEVRVRASDLKRAEHIVEALEDQEPEDLDIGAADTPPVAERDMPEEWDPAEATEEVWTGHDIALARFLADIFRENAIPYRESIDLPTTHHLLVRPPDAPMARELLREIISGTPPS